MASTKSNAWFSARHGRAAWLAGVSAVALGMMIAAAAPAAAQQIGATGGAGGVGPDGNGGRGGDAGWPDAVGQDGEAGTGIGAGPGGKARLSLTIMTMMDGVPGVAGGGGGGGSGYSREFNGDITVPMPSGSIGVSADGGRGGDSDGGSGGGGGGGGDGVRNSAAVVEVRATVTGGNGGNGGNGLNDGGGGGGGAGVVMINTSHLTVNAAVAGGQGGDSRVGGGGGGGAGVILQQGGRLDVNAAIAGGGGGRDSVTIITGGSGGSGVVVNASATINNADGGIITGGAGFATGSGGAGIALANGGGIVNAGQISGGNGGGGYGGAFGAPAAGGTGSGGALGFVPNTLLEGRGGVGITGAGLTIDNSGAIAGGTGYGGQASAIVFTGGANFLSNTGTISGGVNVQGGSFAPALASSPIGNALNIGDAPLTFAAGTSYNIRVSPAASDSVTTSGTATLAGATVNAAFAPGSYMAKQYTILTAGGIGGAFAGLTANTPANFTSSLSYDPNHAYLDLVLNFVPPPPTPGLSFNALNANQQNVANTLVNFFNTSGGIPMAFGALSPEGLSQVSGEAATGAQQVTFDAMNQFMGVMTDPSGAGRDGFGGSNGGASSFADEQDALSHAANGKRRTQRERDAYAAIYTKAPVAAPFVQRWNVWAAGYGGSQTTDGNAGAGSNSATSSIYGMAVGADYRISPDTLVGFALAGGGTNFSVAGGTGRSDLFQAGVFARQSFGATYITAALAYGWQDITTDRTVTANGVDRLRAGFDANAFSGRIESGYRFVAPEFGGAGLTPYVAAQVTTFGLPSYSEHAASGAGTFALAYAAKDVTATRSELGVRTDKSFALDDAMLTLRGRAAWAHNFDTDRSIGATFQTLPGASFVVNGAALAADSALVTASAETKWINGFSLAATFEGEFSNVTESYAGKGVVRYAW